MAAAFDPDCILVGGGISAAGDLLLVPTQLESSRALVSKEHRQEPPILTAGLGSDASFIGAVNRAGPAARGGSSRPMLCPFVDD